MAHVAIIQRVVPHYRVKFFEQLNHELESRGIGLTLFYGQENSGTLPRTVHIDASWAIKIENRYIRLFGKEFVYQPCLRRALKCDLIIIEQANRILSNHLLWSIKRKKLAFWGHGKNFQAPEKNNSFTEILKIRLINTVAWWFAYTKISAKIILECGFPHERITIVENSLDTRDLQLAAEAVSKDDLTCLRKKLKINSEKVGVYIGSMYPEKGLDFLISACIVVKNKIPDFHLVLIGEGPTSDIAKQASSENSWIHYVGAQYSRDRVVYLKLGNALLIPGAVGLAILDSFSLSIPLITTYNDSHGPEIDYLKTGYNGIISQPDINIYAEHIIGFMANSDLKKKLQIGCGESAAHYTLGNMVKNISNGIEQALVR